MAIRTIIGGGGDKRLEAPVVQKGGDTGLAVLTESAHDTIPVVRPLVNPTFGADMNQAISFSGTPELIHDGGDNAGWTGAAGAGTWDFADTTTPNDGTKCVSVTAANNGDNASFTDGTETDMSTHEAVTGQIRLDTYDGAKNSITLQFENNTAAIGNSVSLNDFIDTGLLGAYQGFVISKAAFGIDTQTVDELIWTVQVVGAKPTLRFDQFQIEDDGAPAVFSFVPAPGEELFLHTLKIVMIDNVTATSDYNSFFAVAALANGIIINVRSFDRSVFAGSFSRLADFLTAPLVEFEDRVGATNTWMTFTANFPEKVILRGDTSDLVSFTINDDLSGLVFMRVVLNMTQHEDR